MPTRGSNFDTLSTCDYHRLCAVCPPLPHHYSNIGNRWKSLPSRSKHSLFQKPLSHSHPLAHQKSLSVTPKNHSKSLTHSLLLFMQIEPRKTASPFNCGRKTHSWVSRFASLDWDLKAWGRACKPIWGRSRLLPLFCSAVAGRLGFCVLIFEI